MSPSLVSSCRTSRFDRFPGLWGPQRRREVGWQHEISEACGRHAPDVSDSEGAKAGYLFANAPGELLCREGRTDQGRRNTASFARPGLLRKIDCGHRSKFSETPPGRTRKGIDLRKMKAEIAVV